MKIPNISTGIKALMVVIPLVLAVVIVGVLISRIKEINGGKSSALREQLAFFFEKQGRI